MVESKLVIALPEGIPGNSCNFIEMGQILAVTGITPQILTVIGMGRGATTPSNMGGRGIKTKGS